MLVKTGRMGIVFGTHWMNPHSSFSVTTPYVRMSTKLHQNGFSRHLVLWIGYSRSWRLRDSELAFSSLLMMELNSISRASFLRSSLGFPKKVYVWPSVPRIDIFRGLARDRITSISSKNSMSQLLSATEYLDSRFGVSPWNIGKFAGNGWWVDWDEDDGGKLAVNDSCNGMMSSQWPSGDSRGKSFRIFNVLLSSSIW